MLSADQRLWDDAEQYYRASLEVADATGLAAPEVLRSFFLDELLCRLRAKVFHPTGPRERQVLVPRRTAWPSPRTHFSHSEAKSLSGASVETSRLPGAYSSGFAWPSWVVPRLDQEARRWLREALDLTIPGHPWSARLETGPAG